MSTDPRPSGPAAPPPRIRHWHASALLVAAAIAFVATRMAPGDGYWIGMARMAAEAALIGGLADWFAVVALFRHPLGIPIPHTAVVPNNKDRIAEAMGRFVERNFLDPDLIGARIRRIEPSAHVATWLAKPENAAWLSERLAGLAPVTLSALRDRGLRDFVAGALHEHVRGVDAPGLMGRGLALLRDSEQHQAVFDDILARAGRYVSENRETVLTSVQRRSSWWVPRRVDRRIAETLTDGLVELLAELRQRDHAVRRDFDRALDGLIERLQHDPDTRARVEQAKADWLGRPDVAASMQRLADSLGDGIERDLASPDSRIRDGLARALQSLGGALGREEAMRARLDERIAAGARALVIPWRHEIGNFIADVMRSWDARTVADRLEQTVGRDLQYIRINGTIVGSLVGCALYAISEAVF